MGWAFNHPIELNQNLTHLTMGHRFNHPIELNQNLTHLTMDCEFNHPIKLNQNLTHLTIYSKKVKLLTNTISNWTYCNKNGLKIINQLLMMNIIILYGSNYVICLFIISIYLTHIFNHFYNLKVFIYKAI